MTERFFIQVQPVIDVKMRQLCLKPYPGHTKGCPNWSKRDICPPRVPLLSDSIDLNFPVYAIYNVFDFAGHVSKMRAKHPKWSDRQVGCCLYWQSAARKQLRKKIKDFLYENPGLTIIQNPEAQGVNITTTMAMVGLKLEWPPENVTYQIVLAGTKYSKNRCDIKVM